MSSSSQNVDAAWKRIARVSPAAEELIVFYPSDSQATLRFVVNPQRCTYYNTDHYDFYPHTLAAAPGRDSWGKYQDAKVMAADGVKRTEATTVQGAKVSIEVSDGKAPSTCRLGIPEFQANPESVDAGSVPALTSAVRNFGRVSAIRS